MPFKVRATLVDFLGDVETYPCHFDYKIGDEIIFDGEKYIGRICTMVMIPLAMKTHAVHCSGPRYFDYGYYYPFWYVPVSLKDTSRKLYDGIGFKNVLANYEDEPKYFNPPGAMTWPPAQERTIGKEVMVVCGDIRTAAAFRLEPFDLSDKGFDIPYFRRQMIIMDRVLKKQGVDLDKILDQFSREEIEEIYPVMTFILAKILIEECELLNYIEVKDGKTYVTEKGEKRLKEFKNSLSAEEKKALKV